MIRPLYFRKRRRGELRYPFSMSLVSVIPKCFLVLSPVFIRLALHSGFCRRLRRLRDRDCHCRDRRCRLKAKVEPPERFDYLFRGQLWLTVSDEPDQAFVRGREEFLEGVLDSTINVVSIPKHVEQILFHVAPRDQSQGLDSLGFVVFGELDAPEELLFGIQGGVGIVEPILISIAQNAPFNPGDGCVGQNLRDPFPIRECLAEPFRFDEEPGLAKNGQTVIDGTIDGLCLELTEDLIRVAHVPTQGFEHWFNQRSL